MDCDRVLVVAGMGASHSHGPPHKLGVVGQLEAELGGGAEASQEHVLQVYKWGSEAASIECGNQGAGEHITCSTEEGGENIERIEGWRKIPFTLGVSDRDGLHHVTNEGVVNVLRHHLGLVLVVRNVDHHTVQVAGL